MGKPRVVAETGRGIERQKQRKSIEERTCLEGAECSGFPTSVFYKYTKAILEDNILCLVKNPYFRHGYYC